MMKTLALISSLSLAALSAPIPGRAQDGQPHLVTTTCILAPTAEAMLRFVGDPVEQAQDYVEECHQLDLPIEYVFFEEAIACLLAGYLQPRWIAPMG